jgi:hypothetical protein
MYGQQNIKFHYTDILWCTVNRTLSLVACCYVTVCVDVCTLYFRIEDSKVCNRGRWEQSVGDGEDMKYNTANERNVVLNIFILKVNIHITWELLHQNTVLQFMNITVLSRLTQCDPLCNKILTKFMCCNFLTWRHTLKKAVKGRTSVQFISKH